MYALPLCCWFFVGSQSLNMSCDDVDSPKRSIPAGQRVVVFTLVGMAVFVFIVWASLPPGVRSTLALPAPLGKGSTVCCYGYGLGGGGRAAIDSCRVMILLMCVCVCVVGCRI